MKRYFITLIFITCAFSFQISKVEKELTFKSDHISIIELFDSLSTKLELQFIYDSDSFKNKFIAVDYNSSTIKMILSDLKTKLKHIEITEKNNIVILRFNVNLSEKELTKKKHKAAEDDLEKVIKEESKRLKKNDQSQLIKDAYKEKEDVTSKNPIDSICFLSFSIIFNR